MSRSQAGWVLVFGVVIATLIYATCVNNSRTTGTPSVNAIQVVPHNFPSGLTGAFQRGYQSWNSTQCNIGLDSFPKFQEYAGAERRIDLYYHSGFNPNDDKRCAEFSGLEVHLYELARDGTDQRACTREDIFEQTISHELGHTLGFGHPSCTQCSDYGMANATWNSGSYVQRSLKSDECEMARATHYTPSEQESDQCELGSCEEDQCTESTSNACTPIVVDLRGDGFRFTGLGEPVMFDIDADALAETTGWTARRHADMFLCMDRNDNGLIDDGSELFGGATPLLEGGQADHGYHALAEMEALLGNANGWVDEEDEMYDTLCLWMDSNHNGRTEKREILGLRSAGVTALSVRYEASILQDAHGNRLRFLGDAYVEAATGEAERVRTVDVYFVSGERGKERPVP